MLSKKVNALGTQGFMRQGTDLSSYTDAAAFSSLFKSPTLPWDKTPPFYKPDPY